MSGSGIVIRTLIAFGSNRNRYRAMQAKARQRDNIEAVQAAELGLLMRADHPILGGASFLCSSGDLATHSSAFLPPAYRPITMDYHPILPAGIYKKAPDMVYLSHKSIAGCPAPRGGRENRKAGENPARDRRRKGRVPAQKVTASAGRRADTVTPEPEDLPGRPYCRRSGRSHAVGRTKRYAGMTETALDGFVFLRPFRVFWKGALFL